MLIRTRERCPPGTPQTQGGFAVNRCCKLGAPRSCRRCRAPCRAGQALPREQQVDGAELEAERLARPGAGDDQHAGPSP